MSRRNRRIAVVGAGLAGLAVATELARDCRVSLVDRLPVAGGVLPYDAAPVRALAAGCIAAGVDHRLGTTAIRWGERGLLLVGPDGIGWLEADELVICGGSRPSTQAELRIAGPRLAGVLPATVAIHFTEAGVVLGRRPALVGVGDWAAAAARELAHVDCEVTVVAPRAGDVPDFDHTALVAGWQPVAVVGDSRVDGLLLERDGQRYRLACDAVILGTAPRPLRNVDGAVLDGSERVHFVQPHRDRSTWQSVVDQARAAAAAIAANPMEVSS